MDKSLTVCQANANRLCLALAVTSSLLVVPCFTHQCISAQGHSQPSHIRTQLQAARWLLRSVGHTLNLVQHTQ